MSGYLGLKSNINNYIDDYFSNANTYYHSMIMNIYIYSLASNTKKISESTNCKCIQCNPEDRNVNSWSESDYADEADVKICQLYYHKVDLRDFVPNLSNMNPGQVESLGSSMLYNEAYPEYTPSLNDQLMKVNTQQLASALCKLAEDLAWQQHYAMIESDDGDALNQTM